jgi:glycosyltransferase involved in cell wall biosynthesis
MKKNSVSVVIPCYKVSNHILNVLSSIGPEVNRIYVIDDGCPEKTGNFVESKCKDKRVKVLYHDENRGVGGAVKTGYKEAMKDRSEIVIKIDGDGQMDVMQIFSLIAPIQKNEADYTKGNRFFDLDTLNNMPTVRLLGNAILSLITKFSSGYWSIYDPTNGFTAISKSALEKLNLDKVDERYFFESDMLFRLNLIKAVVKDVPMPPQYGNEVSNLSVLNSLWRFPLKNLRNFYKRIFYTYLGYSSFS